MKKTIGLWLIGVVLVSASPNYKVYTSYADFKKGKVEGVSISSQGILGLAPSLEKLADLEAPYVWTAVKDSAGNLYVGTGNEGKVFRISPQGDTSVYFDAEEPEVHALAIGGRKGEIFAATSPDGKVYWIPSAEKSEVYFDPPEKYIWALALDEEGALWVATGDEKGKLYRVKKQNQAETVFESDESHLRSLAVRNKGEVYVGTANNGWVYRITADGRPFALFDTPYQEVLKILLTPEALYVMGGSAAPKMKAPAGKVAQMPDIASLAQQFMQGDFSNLASTVQEITEQMEEAPTLPPVPAGPRKSGIVKITYEGIGQTLWETSSDDLYALAPSSPSGFLVGTGKQGFLYFISTEGKETLESDLDEEQITELLPDTSGTYFVLTSNLGKVYRLTGKRQSEGFYISEVFDAGILSDWGAVEKEVALPAGARAEFYTRTGNTDKPESTWGEWKPAKDDKIQSASARYLQWKVILSSDGSRSPEVHKFAFSYLQRNLPPSVSSVQIVSPTQAAKQAAQPPGRADMEALMTSAVQQVFGGETEMPPPGPPPPRPTQKGLQVITWRASDPNGDKMTYTLYYRLNTESRWKLLKDKLVTSRFNWDTTTLPDGTYFVKVVASDAPSNPDPIALTGESISDAFVLDNSPPVITDLKARSEKSKIFISFRVSDAWSRIDGAEYSLDSDSWKVILPADGIPDSKSESYIFSITGISEGEHTITLKVTDIADNTAYSYTVVTS